MNLRDKRTVLTVLAVIAALLFVGGIIAGYASRNDRICPDGKPPVQQRSEVIGQTEYLCHDGHVVTK